ncbi:MAG: flagellar motor switch protein FliN [Pseudomonadota bacterium]
MSTTEPESDEIDFSLPEISEPAPTPQSFEAVESSPSPLPQRALDNVPVKVSAVLGKVRIEVSKLRALGDGAIIELNRKVGEPIDLYINDRLIGRGELVIVDGSLGVTMTEIVNEEI